ncbi:MAG: hypothetical protein RIC51_04330, partial [Erythrobacter sp.]
MAAALALVLLPLVVTGEGTRAQDRGGGDGGVSAETVRTISNIAEANWRVRGTAGQTRSNRVTFEVALPTPEIRAFRAAPGGSDRLTFTQPVCSPSGQNAQANTAADPQDNASAAAAEPLSANVERTQLLRAGQDLFFEVRAMAANTDPGAIDRMDIRITSSIGDVERETVFETGPDTGIFVGRIETRRMPPVMAAGDCVLSIADGAQIEIAAMVSGSQTVMVSTEIAALADPFGVVFDSETGAPVDGARVTLVDDATGQPASVFGPDGVTPWPSSVVSGAPVIDGAGRVTQVGPGDFWFPLT